MLGILCDAVISRAFDAVLLQQACGHDARQAAEGVEESDARFEIARTRLDLATVAHRRGDSREAAAQLHDAHGPFDALEVPGR